VRYLAQLARETTARVLPSRAPSWTPALPLQFEEAFVAGPRERPQSREIWRSPDQEPAGGEHERDRREARAERSEAQRRRRAEPPQGADAIDLEPVPQAATSERIAPRQPARLPAQEASTETARPVGNRHMPDPAIRAGVRPPAAGTELNSTLSRAFAEIARRQALLEARQEKEEAAERASPRPPPSPADQTWTTAPERTRLQQPQPEDLRLSIGSIIVQADPPTAAPIRPPKPPPPRPRIRWARSFADR
jgi:hypothetical protein